MKSHETNLWQELRTGYETYGLKYMLFPMPVLSVLVISMLLTAAALSIIYLPVVLALLALLVIVVLVFAVFS